MRAAPPIRPSASTGGALAAPAPTTPSVDPRISARRIAVRRDEGRRRLRRLAAVGAVLLVPLCALGATRTPLLDLDHLDVSGAPRLGADAVRAVVAEAGVRSGRPMVDLDLGRAEAALEALPAVQEAHVVRHWPGRVEVRVLERVPVAAVTLDLGGGATGQAIIGADGIVVAVETAPTDLVVIDGPATLAAGDRYEGEGLLAVAAALPATLRPFLVGVGADPGTGGGPAEVELRLAQGGVVRLGPADQLGAKLVAAETVLRQVDTACLAVLDVRVPSAPTVTRRPAC